jgi:hypothetical protein
MTSFPWPACGYHPIFDFDVCKLIWSISTERLVPFLFSISAGILLWVCVTGAAALRLRKIEPRCIKLLAKVTGRVDEMKDLVSTILPNGPDQPPAT